MAQGRYETPVDANFVLAYDTYKHQVAEVDRAHSLNRRSVPSNRQESERQVLLERQTPHDIKERATERGLMRYVVSSVLIGYTAAMAVLMAADGPSATGATRL